MENELINSFNKITDSLNKLEKSTKSISNIVGEIKSLDKVCSALSTTSNKLDTKNLKDYFDSIYSGLKKIMNVEGDLEKIGIQINKVFGIVSETSETLNDGAGKFISVMMELSGGVATMSSVGSSITEVGQSTAVIGESIATVGAQASISLGSVATAAETATVSTGGFGTAMSFMAAHPVGVAVTAIGLLAGAFLGVSKLMGDTSDASSKFNEMQEKNRERIDEVTESLRENAEELKNTQSTIDADYSLTLDQVDQLVAMTGKDGYVGNIDEAKYLIDQINAVLPNSVELVDGSKVVWKDLNGEITSNTEEIKKNIEILKQRAIVEAYQEKYLEAIREESSITAERVKAQNALEAAERRHNELRMCGMDLTNEEKAEKRELEKQIEGYRKTIKSCDEQLVEITNTTRDFEAMQKSLSGKTEDMANAMVEQYTIVDINGEKTWESLGTGLMNLDAKIQAHTEHSKTMSESELAATKLAKDSIVESLQEKAREYGYSYNEMIGVLERQGIYLKEEEKTQFRESLSIIDKSEREKQRIVRDSKEYIRDINNSGLSVINEDTKKLEEAYTIFAESGDVSGKRLCGELQRSIHDNNGQVTDGMHELVCKITKQAENTKIKLLITTEVEDATVKITSMTKKVIASLPSFIKMRKFASREDSHQ